MTNFLIMKNSLQRFSLVFTTLLILSGSAAHALQADTLKGRVKSVTELEYSVHKKSGVKWKKEDFKTEINFDASGAEKEALTYNSKGVLQTISVNVYDAKGRLSGMVFINGSGDTDRTTSIQYDAKGNHTAEMVYGGGNVLEEKHEFRYQDGRQVGFMSYDGTGTLTMAVENSVDARGNLAKEVYRDANDSLEFTILFTYGKDDMPASEEYLDNKGERQYKLTFEYEDIDAAGNWRKKTIFKDGKKETVVERKITY